MLRVYKIILYGKQGVGKSSFVNKYLGRSFVRDGGGTGFEFNYFDEWLDGKKFKVSLWQNNYEDNPHKISKTFYQQSKGGIFMFDITNRQTLMDLIPTIAEFYKHNKRRLPILLVGNKKDLHNNKTKSNSKLARELVISLSIHLNMKIKYIETSIPKNKNIDKVIKDILRSIYSWDNYLHLENEQLCEKVLQSKITNEYDKAMVIENISDEELLVKIIISGYSRRIKFLALKQLIFLNRKIIQTIPIDGFSHEIKSIIDLCNFDPDLVKDRLFDESLPLTRNFAIYLIDDNDVLEEIALNNSSNEITKFVALSKLDRRSIQFLQNIAEIGDSGFIRTIAKIKLNNFRNSNIEYRYDEKLQDKTSLRYLVANNNPDDKPLIMKKFNREVYDTEIEKLEKTLMKDNQMPQIEKLNYLYHKILTPDNIEEMVLDYNKPNDIRITALKLIDAGYQALFEKLANNSQDEEIKINSVLRLQNQLVLKNLVNDEKCKKRVRITAITNINNSDILKEIALSEIHPNIRREAIKKISDNDDLLEIVLNEENLENALLALNQITDLKALKILRLMAPSEIQPTVKSRLYKFMNENDE